MISKFIKNALDVRKTDKGYLPLRFSENQIKMFENYSDLCKTRVYCPAGVYLNFRTTDKVVSFDYYTDTVARDWYCFDIYENGIFVKKICGDRYIDGKATITYAVQNPDNNPEIKIYLPHANKIYLNNLTGNVSVVENKSKVNYLALGDSITQGMDSRSPSLTYTVQLQEFFGCNLLNQGVGGTVFDHKVLDHELPFTPDFITVAYGTNDYKTIESLDEINHNTGLYFEKVRHIYPNTLIFAITPLYREDAKDENLKKLNNVRAIIDNCSKKQGICTIDGTKIFPEICDFFGDLRLHPSSEGCLYMAINIAKHMLKHNVFPI